MNVLDAIVNFRSALLGVVPAFERARLPWGRLDAYDEWDAVASALFISLVESVLKWRLPDALQGSFRLCAYDLLLPRYNNVSTIEVLTDGHDGDRRILHALGTAKEPFDSLEARRVSAEGIPRNSDLEVIPLNGIILQLKVRDPGTGIEVLILQ